MENQYSVIADKEKNRLYVDLYDIDVEQARNIIDEIWERSQELNGGWGSIVNYTAIDIPLTEELLDVVETGMSFLKQLGMGQLVRVFNKGQSSYADELKKRSIRLGGYEGIEARTIQDANAILDRIPS
jgi:hypothetical protein